MRIVEGFCIREFLDEIIAIPTGKVSQTFSGIISLNAVGQFLFERLQTEQTEQTLLQAMMEEYEVDEATAREDIRDFLKDLRTNGLLIE